MTDTPRAETSQPRKRVRTGCLKCRQRRRKCDEARPKCGSCTEKGFECRYSLQLSFPKDKAFTIRPEEAPPAGLLGKYGTVKFVGDQPDTAAQDRRGSGKRRRVGARRSSQTSDAARPVRLEDHERLSSMNEAADEVDQRSAAGLVGQAESQIGLSPSAARHVVHSPEAVAELDAEIRAKLWRHWRYELAPHLDIYDLKQPFGVRVSALAKTLRPLQDRLLSLAATSSRTSGLDTDCLSKASPRDKQPDPVGSGDSDLVLARQAVDVLDVLEGVIIGGSRASSLPQVSSAALPVSSSEDELSSVLTWAAFILQLGNALTKDAKFDIPHSIVADAHGQDPVSQDLRHRLRLSAMQVCHLCAEAANLRHTSQGGSAAFSLRGIDLLEGWRQLWDALQRWSDLRPSELYPALETYLEPQDAFPTLLFTTPCANFCTQIYHTAALLMLQCKPRTMQITESSPGAVSPLWHARRVCAVALSNDSSEKWHPTTWAAFMYTARYVASRSEQKRVLRHAGDVLSMTKWRMQSDLVHLQDHWASFGG